MERFLYEARPYAYILFAMVAIVATNSRSVPLYFFAANLVICSLVIVYARQANRASRHPITKRS